jgi:type I restriction enzyme S subunit
MKWPLFQLEEIADVTGGSTPRRDSPEYWNGDIPWLTPTDLPMPGTKIAEVHDTSEHITPEGLSSCAANLVPVGTVLYSSRATIGKIGIARVALATNQGFVNFIPKPEVNSKYLAYALQYFTAEISSLAGSTTFKEVRRGSLKKYKVPLPPLSEQRRIAEILDQADALRKKRVEADAKAARILPALFYKMFGDPATNPKGLDKRRLGDLIKVRSGNFLPAKNMERDGQYPVYGGNGINGYHAKYMFDQPVIVLGRVGIYCGAVHFSEGKCWVTDNALYVAEKSDDLHPRYLAEALRVANLNQYAGRAGQPLISGSRIYPIEILVPSRGEQEEFAHRIADLHWYEKGRKHAGYYLEKLFSVLLHRAFTGDLTAKWREAHMKELLAEIEAQAKALGLSKN